MSSNLTLFARHVSRIKPADLPEKFLELDNILQQSTAVTSVKYEIIALDILPLLSLSLRQDFNQINNGWRLASVSLCKLASTCMCVEVDRSNAKTKAWSNKFFDQFLPQGIDSFLILARRLQDQYTQEKKAQIREDYLSYLHAVISNLLEILTFHANEYELMQRVFLSVKFMELFLTDDVRLCPLIIDFFEEIVRKSRRPTGPSLFYNLSNKLKQDYISELAYKLTVFDNNDVGRAAVRALISVCEADPKVIFILADKFKGLSTILQRWHGRGFGMDLQDLLAILSRGEKGGYFSSEYRRENYAASRIQSVWRGYASRRKMAKVHEAIKRFQSSFRKRKERETRMKEEQRRRAELQYEATREHLRRLRQFKLQQVQAIQLLPASEIDRYLDIQRLRSATKIQATFRGYLLRRNLVRGGYSRLIADRAARRIQRAYRRYQRRKQAELDRRQKRLEYIKPSILTDAKREELIEQIEKWKNERAPKAMSDEEFQALHARAQGSLNRYVTTNRAWRRIEQRQRLLLHMLNNDSEFLQTNYPKLKSVMESGKEQSASIKKLDQAAAYLTHPSSAIRYHARQSHIEALKYARAPWYKSLQAANMAEDEDEDEDEYFNRGGVDEFHQNDILNNPTRYEFEKSKFHVFSSNTMTSPVDHH